MQVILTELAERSIQSIYYYYFEEATEDVAHKIKDRILNKISLLESFSNRGRIEDALKELNQGHRFLLAGHYKIIYFSEGNNVYVTDIFDTQQDPDKIIKRHQS